MYVIRILFKFPGYGSGTALPGLQSASSGFRLSLGLGRNDRGTGIAQAATCHAGLDPASTHVYQLPPKRFAMPNLTRQFKEDTTYQ